MLADQSALIEDLQAENAWLKDMLGLKPQFAQLMRLRTLGLAPQCAHLALAFLKRPGAVATYDSLAECLPAQDHATDRNDQLLVKVYVCRLRKLLGFDAIETVWCSGYRMTNAGADKLRSLLGSLAP